MALTIFEPRHHCCSNCLMRARYLTRRRTANVDAGAPTAASAAAGAADEVFPGCHEMGCDLVCLLRFGLGRHGPGQQDAVADAFNIDFRTGNKPLDGSTDRADIGLTAMS